MLRPVLTTNRHRLAVYQEGPVKSDLPVLIHGHGVMGSCASDDALAVPDWRRCADHVQLFRYDARGHGNSPDDSNPDHYSWQQAGDDLADVIESVRALVGPNKRIILSGASRSAAAVLHYVTRNGAPAWLSGLMLAIPPVSGARRDVFRPIYRDWASRVRQGGTAGLWKYLLTLSPAPYFRSVRPDYRTVLEPFFLRMDAASLAAMLEGAAQSDLPVAADLRQIALPTFILCRDHDAVHPVAMGEEIAQLIAGSQLHIGSTGEDMLTWPQLITDFVKENTGKK